MPKSSVEPSRPRVAPARQTSESIVSAQAGATKGDLVSAISSSETGSGHQFVRDVASRAKLLLSAAAVDRNVCELPLLPPSTVPDSKVLTRTESSETPSTGLAIASRRNTIFTKSPCDVFSVSPSVPPYTDTPVMETQQTDGGLVDAERWRTIKPVPVPILTASQHFLEDLERLLAGPPDVLVNARKEVGTVLSADGQKGFKARRGKPDGSTLGSFWSPVKSASDRPRRRRDQLPGDDACDTSPRKALKQVRQFIIASSRDLRDGDDTTDAKWPEATQQAAVKLARCYYSEGKYLEAAVAMAEAADSPKNRVLSAQIIEAVLLNTQGIKNASWEYAARFRELADLDPSFAERSIENIVKALWQNQQDVRAGITPGVVGRSVQACAQLASAAAILDCLRGNAQQVTERLASYADVRSAVLVGAMPQKVGQILLDERLISFDDLSDFPDFCRAVASQWTVGAEDADLHKLKASYDEVLTHVACRPVLSNPQKKAVDKSWKQLIELVGSGGDTVVNRAVRTRVEVRLRGDAASATNKSSDRIVGYLNVTALTMALRGVLCAPDGERAVWLDRIGFLVKQGADVYRATREMGDLGALRAWAGTTGRPRAGKGGDIVAQIRQEMGRMEKRVMGEAGRVPQGYSLLDRCLCDENVVMKNQTVVWPLQQSEKMQGPHSIEPSLTVRRRLFTWLEAVKYCNQLSLDEKLEPVYTITEPEIPSRPGSTHDMRELVSFNPDANGYRLPTADEGVVALSRAEAAMSGGGDRHGTRARRDRVPNEDHFRIPCFRSLEWVHPGSRQEGDRWSGRSLAWSTTGDDGAVPADRKERLAELRPVRRCP